MNKILLSLFVFCSYISFASPLTSGTYTIGGDSPDFITVSEAVDSLNSKGISGKVYFDIRAGYYNEQFVISNFPKSSAADSVFFESESGYCWDVVIYYAAGDESDNYIVKFDHASNVVFRDLTLYSNGSMVYYRQVLLTNNNKNIKFQNNNFIAPYTYASGTFIMTGQNTVDSNISIHYNYFSGGNVALDFSSSSAGLQTGKISVTSNYFEYQNEIAVSVRSASEIFVGYNEIVFNPYSGIGVYIADCNTNTYIDVSANKIDKGSVQIENCKDLTATEQIWVYNNRIACDYNGLQLSNVNGARVYHNSVVSKTMDNFEATVSLSNDSSIYVRNNMFMNSYGQVILADSIQGIIDNNYYYTYYAAPFSYNVSNLTDWIAQTGWDSNSVASPVMPKFVDSDSTLLILVSGNDPLLYSPLDLYAELPVDFEGDPHYSNPCYGADEYVYEGTPQAYINGTITYGADTVRAGRIILWADSSNNYMFDIIADEAIDYNGGYSVIDFTRRNYVLQVIPDSIKYPNLIPTYYGGVFEWENSWVFTPDSNVFTTVNVDVIQLQTIEQGAVTISGYVYDDGANKTNDPIPGLDIILDKIPPSKSVMKVKTDENGYYEFKNVPAGTFDVKLDRTGLNKDSTYFVNTNGVSEIKDLTYCVNSNVNTCAGGNGVKVVKKKSQNALVYPNPFSDELNVSLPYFNGSASISVFDVLGKQVLRELTNNSGGFLTINTSSLHAGIYLVKINTDGISSEYKMVKN
ncbi:MAG: T9SS type A sorting domain-containing protein [Bacteroidetes bacterium]|nr:T9SS type A sorting domain-containing protein [Bacteroidota bacterium]